MHVLFSQVFIFIYNGTIQRAEEKLLDLYRIALDKILSMANVVIYKTLYMTTLAIDKILSKSIQSYLITKTLTTNKHPYCFGISNI